MIALLTGLLLLRRPLPLSETTFELRGKLARLAVRRTGEVHDDGNCVGEPGYVFRARIVFEVTLENGRRVNTSLGDLLGRDQTVRTTSFPPKLKMEFGDYNHDGLPDFNMASVGCGNGDLYWLFEVQPGGKIKWLPVEATEGVWVSGGGVQSTPEILETPEGFRAVFYDNSRGEYVTSLYLWNEQNRRFELIDETGPDLDEDDDDSP